MKILLDECLPLDFRHSFPDHEAHTAQWAGLKRKKNGALLEAAETAGYQVFITAVRGLPDQQRLHGRKMSILVLQTKTNQLSDLLLLVNEISAVLMTLQIGNGALIRLAG